MASRALWPRARATPILWGRGSQTQRVPSPRGHSLTGTRGGLPLPFPISLFLPQPASCLPQLHTDRRTGQPIVRTPEFSLGAESASKVRKWEAKSKSMAGQPHYIHHPFSTENKAKAGGGAALLSAESMRRDCEGPQGKGSGARVRTGAPGTPHSLTGTPSKTGHSSPCLSQELTLSPQVRVQAPAGIWG